MKIFEQHSSEIKSGVTPYNKVWKRFSVSHPTDELIKKRVFWSNELQRSGHIKYGVDSFLDHLAGADRGDGRARVGKFDKQLLKAIIKLTSQHKGNLLNHDRAVCI